MEYNKDIVKKTVEEVLKILIRGEDGKIEVERAMEELERYCEKQRRGINEVLKPLAEKIEEERKKYLEEARAKGKEVREGEKNELFEIVAGSFGLAFLIMKNIIRKWELEKV